MNLKMEGIMKLNVYEQAQRIMERIDEFDKMDAALRSAAQDVKDKRNKNDAEDLAALIMDLVDTKDGERVLDSIVGAFLLRFEDAKRELRKMFDEL
jgi:hypothetical protein